jgi:hypothetical protein
VLLFVPSSIATHPVGMVLFTLSLDMMMHIKMSFTAHPDGSPGVTLPLGALAELPAETKDITIISPLLLRCY